ncbi:MAG: glycosyltransferase family 2 protein [Gammaproteobacteria bacterium]|nr:glycosyltransferase family 2 protein [Gammaproteobacteria bacterium]
MGTRSWQVSVIIPVYNSERCLQQALDSVLAQSWDDFKIIVVDDGSETDTAAQVVAQTQQSSIRPIRYLRQDNQGPAAARNQGLAMSDSEFVAFLDSDDTFDPNKLSLQVGMMTDLPKDYAFVTGGQRRYSQDTPTKTKIVLPSLVDGDIYQALVKGDVRIPWTPGAHLFRRSALTAVGGFDPRLRYGEDKELLIRLARKFRVKTYREVVLCKRLHSRSLSTSLDQEILLESISYLVNKLKQSDPDLSEVVLNGIHQTAIVSATIRSLSRQENPYRSIALIKKTVRRTGLSISWRARARIALAYALMLARQAGRFVTDRRESKPLTLL